MKEQGFYKLKPLQKPLLSDKHRLNRLKFAKVNKKCDWSKIIFTDEATIFQFSKPKKVWRKKDEIIKVATVKHSAKVNIWGCFSEKGFGQIYCFRNNLNADQLCHIYKHTLLPSATTFFGKDNDKWILQEDNDPKHLSGKAQKWKIDNQINRLSWPSQSPDLNPMENVWSVLKANVGNHKPTSAKDLIRVIKKEWKALDPIFAKNLVISMQNCISLLLANEGDHFLY